jgi:alkane 1-monooxygenase
MNRKDAKYLIAFLLPLSAYIGLKFQGILAPGSIYLGFVLIPVFDQLIIQDKTNNSSQEIVTKDHWVWFDMLLWINIPIVYFILISFAQILQSQQLSLFEQIASCFNVGLVFSACGINVAHELGHRKEWYNKLFARILLLPSFYMHFSISHNYGHHKRVGTPEDAVTARFNESLYIFLPRAVSGVYLEAWKLEGIRLKKIGLRAFHWKNEMIRISFFQSLYVLGILWFFDLRVLVFLIFAAIFSFLMLETIDYVEHYGLTRKKLASGKYERVSEMHSWTSDHRLGRIFLFELVRHADHHLQSTKKYQNLDHLSKSPELPYGYPLSILFALVPPLWFRIMNPLAEQYKS